jgi:hypothetical protein
MKKEDGKTLRIAPPVNGDAARIGNSDYLRRHSSLP